MANNLKKFFDKMEDMTPYVHKTSKDLRDLDVKAQEAMIKTKLKMLDFITNFKKLNRDQKAKAFKEVQALLNDAQKYQATKVSMTQKQYDMVDVRITQLDREWHGYIENHRHNAITEQNRLAGVADDSDGGVRRKKNTPGRKDKKKDGKSRLPQHAVAFETFNPIPIAITPVVDMPIDPNEPRYCTCNQVSFGEMIMCDGKHCKIEWFHFQCVGLTQSPPGKWFCEACTQLRKKK